jgi:mono/diheme cytochrome c family protein
MTGLSWWLKRLSLVLLAAFLLIQAVPYGRAHDDPAVTGEPNWDSKRTAQLVDAACGDCHSNLTDWAWYSNVAPSSWLVQRDVDEGREILNFSEWDRPQGETGEAVEAVEEGAMPPWQYKLMHSDARLSDAEKQDLIRGLQRTLAADPPG